MDLGSTVSGGLSALPAHRTVNDQSHDDDKDELMGSVIKKRRKRMAKKKHRKLLKKTRIQRRNKK